MDKRSRDFRPITTQTLPLLVKAPALSPTSGRFLCSGQPTPCRLIQRNSNLSKESTPRGGDWITPDAEQEVRIRAWWSGNDERRKCQLSDFTESETRNLNALAALLDESDDSERLMKAEIMREQGKFDLALAILEHPFSGHLQSNLRLQLCLSTMLFYTIRAGVTVH